MFRFLWRAWARPEAVKGDELLASPPATILRFRSRPKDSPGDIVMLNSPQAPEPWTTLPGAGYSYGKAWPLADDRSAETFSISAARLTDARTAYGASAVTTGEQGYASAHRSSSGEGTARDAEDHRNRQ